MADVLSQHSSASRPYSERSFQGRLDKFQRYIAEVTLQDELASPEEKRQAVNDNLRYESFCENIRAVFGPDIKSQDLKAIHRKLCTNPEVKIDWSEVFGYFQTENEEGDGSSEEISVFTVSKRKTIGEAAGDKKRRDTIRSVIYSSEYDCYVTASQKGAISIYNGKLRLQNCIDINESAWMTSCQYLPKLRKVIATTERSIVIWDHKAKGKNQSNIHVIKPLEHSPQCMCLIPSHDEHSDALLIGDDAGFVNLLRLTHNDFVVKTSKDQKRVVKYHVIDPASLTIPIVRRKYHQDWVLQVQYLPDLKSFASCSPGDKISFVIAGLKTLHDSGPASELSIPKGVNAFCYSEKSNIFATGGVDKTIRVWHPNILSRPTGKMVGHLFTIVAIVMNEKDQHIISLSTARVFRVWDVHTLSCLQVFTDSDERSGERRISAMLFDGRHDRLITGSSRIDLWPMTRTVQDAMAVPHTHDHPLSIVVFNLAISQVVTVCTESVIKVWEMETGRQMYQIMEAHGPNIEVTSVAVDVNGTRMVTGAYDGSLKVWEFGSGQEMKTLLYEERKDDDQTVFWLSYAPPASQQEVEEVAPEDLEDNVFVEEEKIAAAVSHKIIALGWNNQLKIFLDDEESSELVFVGLFDGGYEWPPTPSLSTVSSPIGSEQSRTETRRYQPDDGEETIPRKDNMLIHNEITCCSLCDCDVISSTIVSGCSNGNLVLWNYENANVSKVFELAKAELASSYESHRHRNKEQFPHRVNDVAALCHKIFRPDPEEIKRRKKLRRKKMREEAGEMEEDENSGDESEKKSGGEEEDEVNDDPAEEVDIDVKESGDEGENSEEEEVGSQDHRDLSYGIDNDPIPLVEVNFPPVFASCHQDTNIRLWSEDGELLCAISPMTRQVSPVTAICCDEHAHQILVGDAKGYVTAWEVSEFLESSPATLALQARSELIKQVVCWRAHLMKIVCLNYVTSSRVLVTGSTDGSVRVWYPHRGHYVGYFGQHRVWHVTSNPSLPSTPILPYDITEGPLNPVHARSSGRQKKPQTKKYEYPLVFDADRWRPFRRSAYARDRSTQQEMTSQQAQSNLNVIEIRNKKFFSALVKPKADKSGLESDNPIDSNTGAIFHHLPVYRLKTPPLQPRPLNIGYATGWGDDAEDGKNGGPGAKGQGSKNARLNRAALRSKPPSYLRKKDARKDTP